MSDVKITLTADATQLISEIGKAQKALMGLTSQNFSIGGAIGGTNIPKIKFMPEIDPSKLTGLSTDIAKKLQFTPVLDPSRLKESFTFMPEKMTGDASVAGFQAGRPASVRHFEELTDKMLEMNTAAGRAVEGSIAQKRYQEQLDARISEGRKNMLFLGLGVMFAGMAIERAMKSLLQPAQDAVGITEILGATLTLLFLPAMLFLLPIFIMLLEVVNDLSPELKFAIGMIALFILGLGMVMAIFGQFITLVSSLTGYKLAMDALGTTMKLVEDAVVNVNNKLAGDSGLVGKLGLLLAAIMAFAAYEYGKPVAKNETENWIKENIPLIGDFWATGAAGVRRGVNELQRSPIDDIIAKLMLTAPLTMTTPLSVVGKAAGVENSLNPWDLWNFPNYTPPPIELTINNQAMPDGKIKTDASANVPIEQAAASAATVG